MNQENTQHSGGLISVMRESGWTMRSIASVVILTFGGLVTAPAVAAVKQEVGKIQWHKPGKSNAEKLSAKLHDVHALLTRFFASSAGKSLALADIKDRHSQVHGLISDLQDLDKGSMDDFAATEAHIRDKHLPAVIEQRQQAAVKAYRARMDTLMTELKAADGANDAPTFQQHLANAKAFLDKVQVQPFHEKFDPKHLPFSVAKPTAQKPRLTKKDYLAHPVAPLKRVQVAANGSLAGIVTMADLAGTVPVNPSDPSYLAPTDDVQITPAIQAQAKALNNDPVKIYNWVHNNVEYIPTYGSIQGSDMTLQTLKGNDFDQASLLIALLRAANVPSRYVYGTIQVPIAKVENWVGGVTDPNAALNLLGQGGVPVTGITQGGQIAYAQMEHVWVEAWVNFIPSHAAKPGAGNTWVPMDASFKQYTYTQGMNLEQAVPFDAATLYQQTTSTATLDPGGNWVQGFNQNAVQSGVTSYQGILANYVQAQNANATVSDVDGSKNIQLIQLTSLSAGLPYNVLSIGSRMISLGSNVQAHIELSFYANRDDVAGGSPAYSQSFAIPNLAGKRVFLSYQPATSADQSVIDTAAAGNQTSFAAYLVNVVPTLTVEGQVIWSGAAVPEGTAQVFEVSAIYNDVNDTRDYDVVAGDMGALGIDPSGVTASVWSARTQLHDLTNGSETDYASFMQELLYQTILAYWGELDTFTNVTAVDQQAIGYRLPSFGMAIAPLSVQYNFGIAQSATYDSRVLDVKENRITADGLVNDQTTTTAFVENSGYISSYLESSIIDQIFALEAGHSISAVTALGEANNEGLKIYHIDASNVSSTLSSLSISTSAQADIQNAVASGMDAYVPSGNISVDGFTGAGYILLDPLTGSGAYRIDGGRDGNNSPAQPGVYPLPQVPASPVIGLMLSAQLQKANAKLLVNAKGMIIGLAVLRTAAPALPGLAPKSAEQALLEALIVAMLLITAISAFDSKYPRTDIELRHYTSNEGFSKILKSQVIFMTDASGGAGEGAYFADPDQEVPGFAPINPGVSCPPSSVQSTQIATAYDLPRPGATPDPSLAASYIGVEITRQNYFNYLRVPNTHEAVEVVVYTGLIPWPDSPTGFAMPLFPPYSLFANIDLTQSCGIFGG